MSMSVCRNALRYSFSYYSLWLLKPANVLWGSYDSQTFRQWSTRQDKLRAGHRFMELHASFQDAISGTSHRPLVAPAAEDCA